MFSKKPWIVAFAICLAATAEMHAQEPDKGPSKDERSGDEENLRKHGRFWRVSLSGGYYSVELKSITSLSRHQYLLDAALIVDEVTVDTVGQSLVRFYFIKPVTPTVAAGTTKMLVEKGTELLGRASEQAGVDLNTMVVKKYPDTTHARSIEYRLTTEEDLTALFNSVNEAWSTGKGRELKLK